MPVDEGLPVLDVIVMDDADKVGTALRDLVVGESIHYRIGQESRVVVVANPVPFGHKIAIRAMAAGDLVVKYGEVIGQSCVPIGVGEHVHVHNVEGIRGRGDLQRHGEAGETA